LLHNAKKASIYFPIGLHLFLDLFWKVNVVIMCTQRNHYNEIYYLQLIFTSNKFDLLIDSRNQIKNKTWNKDYLVIKINENHRPISASTGTFGKAFSKSQKKKSNGAQLKRTPAKWTRYINYFFYLFRIE
jgi:predicted nucleic-acid-binding Zn-ribbon protein